MHTMRTVQALRSLSISAYRPLAHIARDLSFFDELPFCFKRLIFKAARLEFVHFDFRASC